MKIVSLLPAATEIVCHLGLRDQLMGVSHACRPTAGPAGIPSLTRSRVPLDGDAAAIDRCVRDLLQRGEPLFELDERLLLDLHPDVLLSQSLCNVCAIDGDRIRHVAHQLGPATRLVEWAPATLDDVAHGIEQIADAINAAEAGRAAAANMRRDLCAVRESTSLFSRRPTVVFLEWLDPLFCAGHWIPEMIEIAGGAELLGRHGARSRPIEPADLIAADPEIIIACCCGWPKERTLVTLSGLKTHDWWPRLRAVRNQRVYAIDAQFTFTTPGPELASACRSLAEIIGPPADLSAVA